jgi:xylitol oxidase
MNKISHNWAEHIAFGAVSTHFPTSVAEVQEMVRHAPKVRAIGARHSFNAIADTPGALVSLRALPRRIEIDAASRTVTIDGGITYAELCPVLEEAGWALFNLASIPDFTVVGAVATAIHGSGNSNKNLASSVAALDIVTASGDVVSFRRGDPDFDGAVVNMGALGVVTSMVLDLVPRFDIRQDVYHRLNFDAVVDNFDMLMGSAYSVSLFTHWNGDIVDQAWLKNLSTAVLPTDLFAGVPATHESSPVVGKLPYGTTAQRGLLGPSYDRLPHARIGAIPAVGYEYQSEYFVARADAPAAMRAIRKIEAALHPVMVVSEIRTIAADELWMSPCYKRASLAIHFTWKQDWPSVRKVLPMIERELAPFEVRPHWGKLFTIPSAQLQQRYPMSAEFKQLVAGHDPRGKFRNAFLTANLYG